MANMEGMTYRCIQEDDELCLYLGELTAEKLEEVLYASPCTVVGVEYGIEWNQESGKNEPFERPILRRDVDIIKPDGMRRIEARICPHNNIYIYDRHVGDVYIEAALQLDVEILERGEEDGQILGFLGCDPNEIVGRLTLPDGTEPFYFKKNIDVIHVYTHDGTYHNFWVVEGNKAYEEGGRMLEAQSTIKETARRRLEKMPFDLDGMHATGDEVCLGNPLDPADWWNEYEDKEGNPHYMR